MTSFYFAIPKSNKLHIFDPEYKPVDSALNGFFSFIYFNQLMVLGYLVDYGSQHSGLNAMLQTMRMISDKYRHHLFAHAPRQFYLPSGEPLAQVEEFYFLMGKSYSGI